MSPFEHASIEDLILRKVTQVRGQCAWLRKNLSRIVEWAPIDVPVTKVVGVIVTS